jgi:3-hydroxybutyryl-CoA dehydrogenase
MEIKTVAVIGAGTMGHSLAQVFAQGGFQVRLNDVQEAILAKAKSLIAANLKTLSEMGLAGKDGAETVLGRVSTTPRIEEACQEADFVIEAIIEDEPAKKEIFKVLDKVCPPRTILASNTSYMDIFKFVETNRPEKVLIAHWYAPPHIVPLVEIVRGPQTGQEAVDVVKALMIQLGKKPIVLTKFLPGFIGNRLQSALNQEMLFLLENGYATPQDIDEATKASFGLRMPLLGLAKRMDFAGLDLTQKVLRNRQYVPPQVMTQSPIVDRLISQGKLGVKSGGGFYNYGGRSTAEIMKERDVKLIKLREFLKELGEM